MIKIYYEQEFYLHKNYIYLLYTHYLFHSRLKTISSNVLDELLMLVKLELFIKYEKIIMKLIKNINSHVKLTILNIIRLENIPIIKYIGCKYIINTF